MAAIEWHHGAPPDAMRGKRLLIIGYPMNRNYFDDNRPDIFIGHFHETEGTYVPARGNVRRRSTPGPRYTILG